MFVSLKSQVSGNNMRTVGSGFVDGAAGAGPRGTDIVQVRRTRERADQEVK